jgi:hypothetical protein
MGNLLTECGGRVRGLAGRCSRVWRSCGDRGSIFGEYLGILLLVVAITTAVVATGDIGGKFKLHIGNAIDTISGVKAGTPPPAAPATTPPASNPPAGG